MQQFRLRHIAAASLLACAGMGVQAQVTTGAMTTPRMFHQASTLADGRILVTGGTSSPSAAALASTEVYDPSTGSFMPMAPMLVAKREHAAVALKDGRVLAAGGMTSSSTGSSFAEIFDPATGKWTATAQMNTAYSRTMARLLPDGRVMVAARDTTGHHAEIFDPVKGSFSKSGNMVETTSGHGMVVLADGRVLKMGGYTWEGKFSRNAEIWDPATNEWSATGQMAAERQDIQPVLLPDGKVLVAGGRNSMQLDTSEIFDPATGEFSPGNVMPVAFSPDSSTVLGNGNIVFTDPIARHLLQYQPASASWSLAGPKRGPARESIATRLPDGSLLLAGGAEQNDATSYAAVLDQACAGQDLTLDVTSRKVYADGGSAGIVVSGPAGCRFEAANLPAWLASDPANTLSITDKGTSAVGLTAGANMSGAERTAVFYLANWRVELTQEASTSCPSMPYVSPYSIKVGYLGGTGTAYVTAPATCSWSIGGLPSFATVTSGAGGKGNGSFTWSVPTNSPNSTSRSGSGQVTALGQSSSFTITQDGPAQCPTTPKVSLSSSAFPAAGGTITATVNAAPSCPWNVGTLPPFARLTAGGAGTGNGVFSITASANPAAFRSGNGQLTGPGFTSSFYLSQSANPCVNWSVNPAVVNTPVGGATGSLTITAPASCSWRLAGLPSWLNLTSAGSGSGNGSISYSIAANSGYARNAMLSMTGSGPTQSIRLNQEGVPPPAGCETPIDSGVPANGFLQASGCPAGARGASYYTDRYSFTGVAGKLATITMSSATFNAYLYLRDAGGNVLRSDDDGAGGTNSRISYTLPTSGTYTIEATSTAAYRSGAYVLSVSH
ncbi:Kelch motif-containing protein [Duganella sp. CF458]|uniref:kelch repeat-containing protein n=1 Tax=Duganella sp. CF458 TaxID=1884368 RepID=UPI0008DFDE3E|nr:kelch repeat-containing protein [Duganella sp. CF458]SFF63493.1 Kelch motif-containing protein [Duganella sp. CF458]